MEALIEPQWIEIIPGRWDVRIKIKNKYGEEQEFVASADSYLTEGSGIWFGTKEEQMKALYGDLTLTKEIMET